jgi:hypothetical protein
MPERFPLFHAKDGLRNGAPDSGWTITDVGASLWGGLVEQRPGRPQQRQPVERLLQERAVVGSRPWPRTISTV